MDEHTNGIENEFERKGEKEIMYEVGKSTEEQRKEERNDDTKGNRWETNTEETRGDKNTKGI